MEEGPMPTLGGETDNASPAEKETQPIQSVGSGEADFIAETGREEGFINKRSILIAIVFIVLATIAIYFGVLGGPGHTENKTGNSTNTTTTVALRPGSNINVTEADTFVKNFNLPNASQKPIEAVYLYSECNETNIDKVNLFGPLASLPLDAIANYSLLNQTMLFSTQFEIGVIAPNTLGAYRSRTTANEGYCSQTLGLFRTNSTFTSHEENFSNKNGTISRGYLMQFSNLSGGALYRLKIRYSGSRSGAEVAIAIVLHKNVAIEVAFFGFVGHVDISGLMKDMNYTLQSFESQYG